GAASTLPKPRVVVAGAVAVTTTVAVIAGIADKVVVGTDDAPGSTSLTSTPANGLPVEASVTRPLSELGRSLISTGPPLPGATSLGAYPSALAETLAPTGTVSKSNSPVDVVPVSISPAVTSAPAIGWPV